MKAVYRDTSCVLALYLPEQISSQASELASAVKGPIHSSAILEFEMTFAIHAKEFRGEIPTGSSGRVLSKFQTDIQSGRFPLVPLGSDIKSSTIEIASKILLTEPPFFCERLTGFT